MIILCQVVVYLLQGADYSSAVRKPVTNKPLVQKATSYAATSAADSEKTVSNDDRKPTTTSERGLCVSLYLNMQSTS